MNPLRLVARLISAMSVAAALALAVSGPSAAADAATVERLPNVVIVFCDDLGYADVGCFGAKTPTPNIDRLAREGMKFTDFYVSQAVCSASRASLMTGCYANRVGIRGALGPSSKIGINAEELTLAEVAKMRGYATAIFGKWHLGHLPEFLPTRHGFDEYYGLPYSNDMWPFHPTAKFPPLPMIDGDKVVNPAVSPDDQKLLTKSYTQRSVDFIRRNKSRPFLLYLAHSMPHVPLFVSPEFEGKTGRGLYADVIAEIDWSVGEVLKALEENGIEKNTWVVFTSDNGPWLSYGNHAGSAQPLREGKATMFDGGCRVSCAMRWPGRIPAGSVCRELAATIDILPTLAELIGVELPKDRAIDGRSIVGLMEARPGARSPHEAYYFYWGNELHAVRSGPWKLHFPHTYPTIIEPGRDGRPGRQQQQRIEKALFNLVDDITEQRDVSAEHPEFVARLEALAEQARVELGDSLTKRAGRGLRPPGTAAKAE